MMCINLLTDDIANVLYTLHKFSERNLDLTGWTTHCSKSLLELATTIWFQERIATMNYVAEKNKWHNRSTIAELALFYISQQEQRHGDPLRCYCDDRCKRNAFIRQPIGRPSPSVVHKINDHRDHDATHQQHQYYRPCHLDTPGQA